MFDFIRAHQLNIMLMLCGACAIMALLLCFTKYTTPKRKRILILMEVMAFLLLFFDRLAYVYAGVPGTTAYVMVRVSNFIVFFLTPGIVFGFNLYLMDLLRDEGHQSVIPQRLKAVELITAIGMLMAIIAAFTDLYYYFDQNNQYHRGRGFLIAYIIPVLCPILQYLVIRKYRKAFRKLIFISLTLYIFVPIFCGILQIFTYGISIVNMAMVAVTVSLYFFTYIDINQVVEHAHALELQDVTGEKNRLQRLFDQTATAFVSAVEKKDDFTKGNSVKIAEYAKKIAQKSGKSDDECERVYYAALLHDVGMIGIPDSVIKNEEDPGSWDYDAIRQKPLIGSEILSSITEYPYLSQGAQYSHERYNGTGYPEGLQGEDIPEIARIIAVADAYVTMTTRKRYRDARPQFVARERFVKGAGEEFDPVFADIMVKIIDSESGSILQETVQEIETELFCEAYRDRISNGIPVEEAEKRITFRCETKKEGFSAPSFILFDAYDRRVHSEEKTIREYHYLEYGEIWFDEHMISTAAREMKVTGLSKTESGNTDAYEIVAGRFEDHLKLKMTGPVCSKEIIIALPDSTKSTYIGLTGEHCMLTDIKVEPTGERYGVNDIERIADAIDYTDHLESDIPNLQIDRTRSDATAGIEIENRLKLIFHTMSLPSANLVWHCPYIVLFYSADGMVGGEDYHEYALIKLNGEHNGSNEYAKNSFVLKREEEFPGWEAWKDANKKGVECEVSVERKGNRLVMRTENIGISIENITTVKEEPDKVYIALTGDQVVLTDIRVLQ
ncbi:MAG: HD domain-containing protein [Lachnospiraceae bacterium]|nr:HD domain-containing protein [Lachnospiraceae bacterium]